MDKHLWHLNLNHEKLTTVFSTLIKGFLAKKREAKTCKNLETADKAPIGNNYLNWAVFEVSDNNIMP